jgi:uncharacterized protein
VNLVESVEDGAAEEPVAVLPCWRCGLDVPQFAEVCPHCSARLAVAPDAAPMQRKVRVHSGDSLNLLFISYLILLVVGIIHAAVLGLMVAEKGHRLDRAARERVFTQVAIVEGIDTVIIAVTLLAGRGRFIRERPRLGRRIAAWLLAIPLVAVLLLVNIGYHAALRSILHVPLISDQLMRQVTAIAVVTICVQPAIVEEAYCRLFALDSLRGPLGMHAAVWISATMFGFLHVALFPSVPYLILLGAAAAYMRLMSGTILLPIAMHFVHNLAVLLLTIWLR